MNIARIIRYHANGLSPYFFKQLIKNFIDITALKNDIRIPTNKGPISI